MAVINELDAFCIALSHDVSPTSDPSSPRFMPVVLDEFVGYHTLDRHVPAQPGWSVIVQICHDRARLTVGNQLLVNGLPMTPEDYIKRWRTRLARPVPVVQLAIDKGLQAVAVFQWRHSAGIAARKAGWINPPYPLFGDLLADRGFTTDAVPSLTDQPLSTLTIDLADKGGARAAWWADDFLACSTIRESVVSRRMEFRPVPCSAQFSAPGLYPEAVAHEAAIESI